MRRRLKALWREFTRTVFTALRENFMAETFSLNPSESVWHKLLLPLSSARSQLPLFYRCKLIKTACTGLHAMPSTDRKPNFIDFHFFLSDCFHSPRFIARRSIYFISLFHFLFPNARKFRQNDLLICFSHISRLLRCVGDAMKIPRLCTQTNAIRGIEWKKKLFRSIRLYLHFGCQVDLKSRNSRD